MVLMACSLRVYRSGCDATREKICEPSDQFTESGHPPRVMVNARDVRFVDEGIRNDT